MNALRPAIRRALRPALRSAIGTPLLKDIQLLLAANDGALYINDISTMYRDAAGTTPVTAVDDPVGLWIDQSQGGEDNLGVELVTNGTFDIDADWSKGTGWSISGGVATKSPGVAANLVQNQSFIANVFYLIEFSVSGYSAGTATPVLAGGSAVIGNAVSSNGDYRQILKSTGNTEFRITGNASADLSVDNISIRVIPGYHATQSTAAARPLWKGGTVQGDAADDWLDTGFIQTEDALNIAAAYATAPAVTGTVKVLAGHGSSAENSRAFLSMHTGGNYSFGWMDDYAAPAGAAAESNVVQIMSGDENSGQMFVNNQQVGSNSIPAAINLSGLPISIFATNTEGSGPVGFSDHPIVGVCIMEGRKWTAAETTLVTAYLDSLAGV